MSLSPLPLNQFPYANVDEAEVTADAALVRDCYVNELKHTLRRPGMAEARTLGPSSPVDGLSYWTFKNKVLAVCGGNLYLLDSTLGSTIITSGKFLQARPSFCYPYQSTGSYAVLCNGGSLFYTDGLTATELTPNASSFPPSQATSVATIDTYVLANNLVTPQSFIWCDTDDITTWNAENIATFTSTHDTLHTVDVKWREIFLVGYTGIEIWQNDGTNPFSRLLYIERGCMAPYTWQYADNTHIFLDHERRICQLDGRTPRILSTPFDKVIQQMAKVDDAYADVVKVDGHDFYVITFPTEKVTLVYDLIVKQWQGLWGHWLSGTNTYEHWLAKCYVYYPTTGQHLIGDRRNSTIHTMSSTSYTDNGETLRALRRTGYLTHGKGLRKRTNYLRMKLKSGIGITGAELTAPQLMVRWRDNGSSQWTTEKMISAGPLGATEYVKTLYGTGHYRTRQYEFAWTDEAPFILMEAEESVEMMVS